MSTADQYNRLRDVIEDVGAELELTPPAVERIVAGACGALKRELVARERHAEQLTLGAEA